MRYTCSGQSECYTPTWDCDIDILYGGIESFECRIEGNGSVFYAIVGRYMDDHFLCIPSLEFSCVINAEPLDVPWYAEQLAERFSVTDAITLANGVRALYKYLYF